MASRLHPPSLLLLFLSYIDVVITKLYKLKNIYIYIKKKLIECTARVYIIVNPLSPP